MKTKAELWRCNKPKDFESIEAYLELVREHDPNAHFQQTDLGAVIVFSDGSQHRMGA